jgi:gamma-glutamylcyclotransferase
VANLRLIRAGGSLGSALRGDVGQRLHDSAFRVRCSIQPFECRPAASTAIEYASIWKGKAAPANLCMDPGAEVWGVLYRITRRDLIRLDTTEGVPGPGYRHIVVEAEDGGGRLLKAVAYIAQGTEVDGKPSLRYRSRYRIL